jgi:hypothetical protein
MELFYKVIDKKSRIFLDFNLNFSQKISTYITSYSNYDELNDMDCSGEVFRHIPNH